MESLNLSLDEIISSQRNTNRRAGGGGGGRRRVAGGLGRSGGGGPRRRMSGGGRFAFSNDIPAGKWKHDKFNEVYGGGPKVGGGGGAGGKFRGARRSGGGARAGGGGNIVKLNISNLPDSVITSDLEELFQDYDVMGVSVHYDETGAHLGTADLFVDAVSATDILREFRGIAIDNQEMKFAIVDEGAANITIMDRVRRVRNNPIRKGGGGLRRSGGGPRRGGARRQGGAGTQKGKELTSEDLDKELDAYMSIRNTKS